MPPIPTIAEAMTMTTPETIVHDHQGFGDAVLSVKNLSIDFHLRQHILHACCSSVS